MMKKIVSLLLSVIILLAATTVCNAEWVSTGTDAQGNIRYVDTDTALLTKGTLFMATKTKYVDPTKMPYLEYDIWEYEFDLINKRIRPLDVVVKQAGLSPKRQRSSIGWDTFNPKSPIGTNIAFTLTSILQSTPWTPVNESYEVNLSNALTDGEVYYYWLRGQDQHAVYYSLLQYDSNTGFRSTVLEIIYRGLLPTLSFPPKIITWIDNSHHHYEVIQKVMKAAKRL